MVTHTPATPAANATTNKRRWLSGDRLRNQITGMLFVTPATLLIGVFGLFPISYAIYMSLHSWRIQRRYTLCLPDFAANWRAEAPVWEKDFATEIVPNFNLGACFDNYTKVVGDWGGVFLWILGFIGLFFAYTVWTRIFREENKANNRWMRVITIAFFAGIGALVAIVGLGQLGIGGLPDPSVAKQSRRPSARAVWGVLSHSVIRGKPASNHSLAVSKWTNDSWRCLSTTTPASVFVYSSEVTDQSRSLRWPAWITRFWRSQSLNEISSSFTGFLKRPHRPVRKSTSESGAPILDEKRVMHCHRPSNQ